MAMTRDDAEDALEKYGPDDIAASAAYAAGHEIDAEWRVALERAGHLEGSGKARGHRRGRRG